jgi:transposase-like protein
VSAGGSEARATPFFCPYCGEETLRPFGEDPPDSPAGRGGHADWRCESCTRAFTVRYKGLTGR